MKAAPETPLPAGGVATRFFEDAGDQERSLPGFDQHYSQLSPGRFEGSVTSLRLPGFSILRERMNVAVAQTFTAPDDHVVCFCLPSHDGRLHVDGEGRAGGPFGVGRGWSQIEVSRPGSDLIMILADVDVFDEAASPRSGDVWTVPFAMPADSLFDWLVSLLVFYESEEAVRFSEPDRLVSDLLRDRLDRLLAALAAPQAVSHVLDRQVLATHRDVKDWLEAHPRDPATVASLSRELGRSPAELRSAALAVLGHPLDTVLLTRRLGLARRDIIAARHDKRRISDVALDWGFFHWGRFSGTYRDLFGETPSQTLRGGIPCRRP